jgi:hypothetical protein
MNGLKQQEKGMLKITDAISKGVRYISNVTGFVPNKWR